MRTLPHKAPLSPSPSPGSAPSAAPAAATTCPPNAVAKVGDTAITKEDFDHWLETAARQRAAGCRRRRARSARLHEVRRRARRSSRRQGPAKQTDAQLKKQCKTEYDQLKQQVMQFLIQAEWVQQEAEEQDVKVTDAEVKKSFEDQKKQAFPKEKDYKKFLKTSGMTEEDILFRVKLDTLQSKLTQKVTEDEGKVTDEDDRGVLREEQEALRPARAARPATSS